MSFTEDSDLNGESPQFTLTCTSTGGPATTVTWTRDSETVSGGMTVLDDPVTAQYTHTLTVTGRLGGQYQCTVANNRPSQDSASFNVQGMYTLKIFSCPLSYWSYSRQNLRTQTSSLWQVVHVAMSPPPHPNCLCLPSLSIGSIINCFK